MSHKKLLLTFLGLGFISFITLSFYPIDGYESTGISRLLRLERIKKDSTQKLSLPIGAQLPLNCIELQLTQVEDSISEIIVSKCSPYRQYF